MPGLVRPTEAGLWKVGEAALNEFEARRGWRSLGVEKSLHLFKKDLVENIIALAHPRNKARFHAFQERLDRALEIRVAAIQHFERRPEHGVVDLSLDLEAGNFPVQFIDEGEHATQSELICFGAHAVISLPLRRCIEKGAAVLTNRRARCAERWQPKPSGSGAMARLASKEGKEPKMTV
ncbi:hypothetical protein [Methylocella tundrae]|uniref:hypothetical protein n=1 Tax=Methylocella tundrae TaxID=227605 RepID=UPI00106C961F|nr:hypothetical protein SIN04_08750 [Methylocella tundrae]